MSRLRDELIKVIIKVVITKRPDKMSGFF